MVLLSGRNTQVEIPAEESDTITRTARKADCRDNEELGQRNVPDQIGFDAPHHWDDTRTRQGLGRRGTYLAQTHTSTTVL